MKRRDQVKYFLVIGTFLIIYAIVKIVFPDINWLDETVTTVFAIIAGVAFWLQFRRTENIDEAKFIMELNHQFISNERLTRVEHALEVYYHEINEGKNNPKLNLTLDIKSEERQELINYLVYMEGMAAIIQKGVLELDVIDNLFAYRFFIVVNNPIVQKTELLPYSNYYQGCFKLSKMWTEKFKDDKRKIPLEEYSLYECKNNFRKR